MKFYNKYIVLFLLSFILVGCGKSNASESFLSISDNTIANKLQEISEVPNQEDPEFQNLDLSDVKDPYQLTYDEFINLSLDEIKKIVCVYTDDFRLVYHMDKNKDVTEEDWEKIRFLLYYQIFGKDGLEYIQNLNKIDTIEEVYATISENEIYESLTEEDLHYLEPTSEYLSSLTISEFRNWLEKANIYYNDNASPLDLSSVSDDEIQKIQTEYILELQKVESQNQ